MGPAIKPACFKAYDIRGKVPVELDQDLAYRIGMALARSTGGRRYAVGMDCRRSSPELANALIRGITDTGADVLDLGMCGTEMVYFATISHNLDGGVMITASHNPADYNGMKLVRKESRPISGDSGLDEIGALALTLNAQPAERRGAAQNEQVLEPFVDFLLETVDPEQIGPFKIVANPGNGCAGPIVNRLAESLPCEFVLIHGRPDGSFPNGIPNPLLPENRQATSDAVREHGADLGLAWDGDFDRCFFFDETGAFIEGYYLVGLLAAALLRRQAGAAIIHDPRLIWNTIKVVDAAGGRPIMNKTGHAFIKERMRQEDAVYGGEMSAHHYFRQFSYCDSGMIPWLLVLQEMTATGEPLSALVGAMQRAFPASGEINRRLHDPLAALARVEAVYADDAVGVDRTDGLSLDLGDWRFNLRLSNTEPVVRLNVESRGDAELMQTKTAEILALLDS